MIFEMLNNETRDIQLRKVMVESNSKELLYMLEKLIKTVSNNVIYRKD